MKYYSKLQKFMYDRYGPDELYYFLIKLYIVLFILSLLIKAKILNTIEILIFLIIIYRFFSKNKKRRRKENQAFLELKNNILKPFKNIKRSWNERDYYVYKKCHKCHTTLKLPLPNKRGIKHVKCPKCKKRITFLCLRQEKIEIIKKNTKRR